MHSLIPGAKSGEGRRQHLALTLYVRPHRRARAVQQNPNQHRVDPGLKWELIKNASLQ